MGYYLKRAYKRTLPLILTDRETRKRYVAGVITCEPMGEMSDGTLTWYPCDEEKAYNDFKDVLNWRYTGTLDNIILCQRFADTGKYYFTLL